MFVLLPFCQEQIFLKLHKHSKYFVNVVLTFLNVMELKVV